MAVAGFLGGCQIEHGDITTEPDTTNLAPTATDVAVSFDGSDSVEHIGTSADTDYVMYTSNEGNLYFVNRDNDHLDLMKHMLSTGETSVVVNNFDGADAGGFGAIAPTADGTTVYALTSKSMEIWKLDTIDDSLVRVRSICGTNFWQMYNLTLAESENALYYVSINNGETQKGLFRVDLATNDCQQVLDLTAISGTKRDLTFGGINVWDKHGNFYTPVWSFDYDEGDLALLQVHAEPGNYSARLIHFTDDTTATGARLLPSFRHHSCWSGIGASSAGNIYIGASNHYQSRTIGGPHGNVAIYKYDPDTDNMSLLGDLKQVSSAVDNWMEAESQHKVHTFMMEYRDKKMYFASDDYEPSYLVRGGHLYAIDLATDEIEDVSKTYPFLFTREFDVIANDTESTTNPSGVLVEYWGIKGISLSKNAPVLYGMLYAREEYETGKFNVLPGQVVRVTLP
jgi:hypothetical protein